ncbi:MAG: hypothetical protein UV34_C0023G0002 [Parcubacteria group bacterium GW2011_GWB1_42_6]|nr:MAG: hypothetical protein UV34_C0023G0002 [Parcubacteria group bacterium GW2011_GWB1_42_6]
MINDVFRAMILQAERFRQTGMESQYKEQIILAEKYAGRSHLLSGDVEGKTATEEKLLLEAERSLGHLQFDLGIEEKRYVFILSESDRRAAIAFDRDKIFDEARARIRKLYVA